MRLSTLPLLLSLALAAPALAPAGHAAGYANRLAQETTPSDADARALMNANRFEQAAAAWKQRMEADDQDGEAAFYYAYSLHMNGDLDLAHDAHIHAARFSQRSATALFNHACVHALRNEKDAAFKALEEAIEGGFSNVGQMETDSDMDNLRGDGRFEALLLRLGGVSTTKLADLPPARRFDFYLGQWSMENDGVAERLLSATSAFDGNGLRVVSSEMDGSSSADSLFLYDTNAGKWRQVWMSKDGMVVVLEGALVGEAMVLEMVTEDGKPKTDGRSVFREVSADRFVYDWQQTADGGKTWETVATRVFTRRAAG